MIRPRLSAEQVRRESGAVLVMVGLWLPVLAVLLSFVIDVGNWFEHKRHLQMQADSAALAGGGVFAYPGCDPATVSSTAHAYGGETYNAQIGGTAPADVHMLINSSTFYGQAAPVDTTVSTADPCTAQMVDVKLTETDLPWFLKVGNVVPFINAHARVSILQIDSQAGALPVGVPDVNPRRVAVTFIDESNNGAVLGTAPHIDGAWDRVEQVVRATRVDDGMVAAHYSYFVSSPRPTTVVSYPYMSNERA